MSWISAAILIIWGLVQIVTVIARIMVLSRIKKQVVTVSIKGSYSQLSKSLGRRRNEYRSIAIKCRDTPYAKWLLNEVYTLDAELKSIDNSLGTWTRHINKY